MSRPATPQVQVPIYGPIREAITAGRMDEAAEACRAALKTDPEDIAALILLARIGFTVRRGDLVEMNLSAALAANPESVEALCLLARYKRSLARSVEAKELCLRALAIRCDAPEALAGLGYSHLEEWREAEALDAFQRAVALDSHSADAYDGLGLALQRAGRLEEAESAFNRALKLDPDLVSAHVGATLSGCKLDVRTRAFNRGLSQFAGSVPNLSDFGLLFWQRGNSEFAKLALTAAIDLEPDSEHPRRILGCILIDTGHFESAREVIRDGIKANPKSVALHEQLVYSAKFRDEDRSHLAPMAALLRHPGFGPIDRWRISFALGKAHDDLGEHARAIQYFDEANGIAQFQLWPNSLDRDGLKHKVDATINTYSRELFDRHPGGVDSTEEPILIVGLQRSGSTLLEQILSCHPMVGAAGEVPFLIDRPVEGILPTGEVDLPSLSGYFGRYLARLRSVAPGMPRVTDKMLPNFAQAGLVHLALPNARIVHTHRNPLDTCLSIYMGRIDVEYAHSFSDIAFYYREYQRLMDHWRSALPSDRFFEVEYERLVSDRESVVRALLDFLELPWNDAVLSHEVNPRPIDTLSAWQARQPIYGSSVDRWRRYTPWIGDLLKEFPDFPLTAGYLA